MEDSVILRKETDGKYTLILNGIRAEHLNLEDASILLRRWEKEQLRKGRTERHV